MRFKSRPCRWPLAAALAAGALVGATAPGAAQTAASQPARTIHLDKGRGQLVTLNRAMSDVFVANPATADVDVRSPTQLYVFGKDVGETTVYATNKAGSVVFSATVQVGANVSSVGDMLKLAMPEAAITVTPMNGIVLLTGTVRQPDDIAEAERLTQAFVGKDTQVLARLRTATPLQVSLQVRVAEVSRSFVKDIGMNLASRDQTGGFMFGIGSGRPLGGIGDIDISKYPSVPVTLPGGSTVNLPFDPSTGKYINPIHPGTQYTFNQGPGHTTLNFAGHLLGLDLLSALDLGETDGQVTTLENTSLAALSGETATFLAGGEIPIPVSQGFGTVSIEYKQYGVSLAYTPTVLADGRISLRVKPEVSQLSAAGSVTVPGGYTIPALTTRRAETTVELGSGQSFMIGGLLQNTNDNQIDKAPGIGDLPVIGTLFRSNGFKRNETELVIVVTPYLVKPVDSLAQIALPTDGYKQPTDLGRVLLGQLSSGDSSSRPVPTMAPPADAQPALGAGAALPVGPTPRQPDKQPAPAKAVPGKNGDAAPGFSLN